MKISLEEVGGLLRGRGLTIGVAESSTGGLISHLLTNVPGSSRYFKGSVVAYDNEIKVKILGVRWETLKEYGSVSYQTAREMAEGVRGRLGTEISLSETGITGPARGLPGEKVGLFYIGLSSARGTRVEEHTFHGARLENKQSAAEAALNTLKGYLLELERGLLKNGVFQQAPKAMVMEERDVVTCFLEYQGNISLLRRSQRVGTYKGRWAGVSGYIERGNTPYEQAVVEIREEVGLEKDDIELVKEGEPLEVTNEGLGRKWIVYPYRFRVIKPERVRIDWEHTELKWINPEDIIKYETVPKLAETWWRVA